MSKMAFGLVGDGSECLGFDDVFSADHDFGARLMIWLTDKDYQEFGAQLQQAYEQIDKSKFGFLNISKTSISVNNEGVYRITDFYSKYIGMKHPPITNKEWLRIPEQNLAVATNGKVFYDELKEFSKFREALNQYYPEDVRLKKIAVRCMKLSQAGQYNYARCLKREEFIAANHAKAEFIEAAISVVFLLNYKYKPFYKWMHRAVRNLPILGEITYELCQEIIQENTVVTVNLIEKLCGQIIKVLQQQNLTTLQDDFVLNHAFVIIDKILDPELKLTGPWVE